MEQENEFKKLVSQAQSVNSYMEALRIVDAYEKLEELGASDIDELIFEYIRVGTGNKHLDAALEDRLLFNEQWLFKAVKYREMFDLIDEFAPEAVIKVKVKELTTLAKDFEERGKSEEAIKCLKEALELKPEDKVIKRRLESMFQKPTYGMLRDRTKDLIKKIKDLRSETHFPCTTYLLDPSAARGIGQKKEKYNIDDTIIFHLKAPPDRNAFLTVFHYDKENKLGLLFPAKSADDTFLKADEEKRTLIQAEKQTGRHYLKAILTSEQLIKPQELDFNDEAEMVSAMQKLLISIDSLRSNEWIESVAEFEITEG